MVEPIVVYRENPRSRHYLILDGYLRFRAIQSLGWTKTNCLVAKDDEFFTYNRHINRPTTVQEHKMILRALDQGVPEEKLAAALGVKIARIREKRDLLRGISPEVVEIFKDKRFPTATFGALRHVSETRQIEMAELMVAANNFTIPYARALLAATPQDQLKNPKRAKPAGGLPSKEVERMEAEMAQLQRDLNAVQDNLGANMVKLVVTVGYVGSLLQNDRILRYLKRYHPEIQAQLLQIVEAMAMETKSSN